MRIERRHEQLVAEHAEAAIDEAAARGEVRRQLAAIAPDLRPVRASIAHARFCGPVT
jgi:hypothetical protein